ncbi:response regulator [Leptolyngbya cf. ectocarpi LEGE 11479]|uniref:histidine kinase n=1 Tax=Leptolyngbya cf. ectocarpi LEGE 11479 TaxID=1828722 RepID=A0A929F6L0_LEPEC|nr:response regulator [Leptolyngbya ectocarpi]MBE9067716.1 response regulator [Leptolyngbya cf. ectocarpi LEGE 11479]
MAATVSRRRPHCTITSTPDQDGGSLEQQDSSPHHPANGFENLILVVDDQPANLKLLRQLLTQTSCKLTFASSGRQALERVNAVLPDLILLDLMMPDIDGLTVCQSLRQNPDTADIPIIFLTASHETEHLLQAFEYGAVDYITKPFVPAELLARVRVHLSLKEAQSALNELNQQLEQKVQQRTAALQQAFNFTQVSQRITHRIRSTLDETQIYDTVVRELTSILELNRCQIGIYDNHHSVSTITHEYVEGLPSALGKIYPFSCFNDIYLNLHQGETVHAQLTNNDVQHAVPDSAMFLACPLSDHQNIIGDIWLYRTSLTSFSDDEICLVKHIADQTAIAIRQARLYESSQAQVKDLERLNHAKDDFLKTLSHELRTPLTTIKTSAETIESMLLESEWSSQHQEVAASLFSMLLEGCDREIKLVNDLLEFVHLDIKTPTVTSDIISIDELVTTVTASYEQRCHDRKQHFNLVIPHHLPLLHTNADIVTRVLLEVLDNAGKYTPARETIELVVSYENNRFQFRVRNGGVTMSEAELSQIFDKFYRLPQYDRWQNGGTGLGLALVKKQVHYLGGTVNAAIAKQQLTVCIELPSCPRDSN